MIALVTGGSASGKSAYAECLAASLGTPRTYIATMRHGDAETEERIRRHRAQRAQGGFDTVELADGGRLTAPFRGCALLEDLGNLVANGLEGALDDVLSFDDAVIVGNEVGCDGCEYDAATRSYLGELGALACRIARRADVVVEVAAGVPVAVKGWLP